MARNTSTFGQLPSGAPLLGTDLLVIQRTDGLNFSITGSDLATLVGGLITLNGDATAAQIIAGTANRISLVDAGNVHTFDIDVAYVGQASIVTLGTITTGVWNGSVIDATFLDTNIVYNDQANTYTGGGDQDFATAALRNVDFLEADGAAASDGLVRGRNADDAIAWRNGAGTNNIDIIVNATDTFLLRFNGTTRYLISATQFDFNSRNLVNAIIVTPTIASFTNATHDHTDAAGGAQLLSTSALSDTANIAYVNTLNDFGDFDQTFKDNRILIESPDTLTPVTIINSQQTLARNLTIPILTGNDTIATLGVANVFSGNNQIMQKNGNANNFNILTIKNTTVGTAAVAGMAFASGNASGGFFQNSDGNSNFPGAIFFRNFFNAELRFGANNADKLVVHTNGNLGILATSKIFLDGVEATGDTFISESVANNMKFTSGGASHLDLNATGIGFFSVTPAAQPAHIVDADGTLADITTKFNTLLAQMATLGLQAAS